jgi:hypothetical protein
MYYYTLKFFAVLSKHIIIVQGFCLPVAGVGDNIGFADDNAGSIAEDDAMVQI